MNKKLIIMLVVSAAAVVFTKGETRACTDFRLVAKDGAVVIGRTMEFPVDTKSVIWVIPRGIQNTSINDKGVIGLTWKSRYGFIAIDGFELHSSFIDGMNEKGLSFEGLMFTGAQYQAAVPGKFVTNADLCGWILGNFATVDELKKAVPTIYIADMIKKELHGSMGLHFAVHDAGGKSIVIELLGGQARIYDNPLGVMTNRPAFEWHINNLRNYINLDANDRKPRTINGVTIEPAGVGSGLLGLPGDWTPPSRFVKVAFCVDGAIPAKNAIEAVNLAEHIMNSIDIPIGMIKEHPYPFIKMYGNAQWSVIKDLTNLVLYYRTYGSMTLRKIDLKKIDTSEGAPKKSIPLRSKQYIIDVTGEMK